MADLQGTCDERFGALKDALARNVDSGAELGASVVLDLDGEIAVDLWGGYRDEARTQAVGAGHDHQRLVDDQDSDEPGGPDAGRPRRARRRRARRPVLA